VDVALGFAAALDLRPNAFDRAVLVAFGRGVEAGDRAIKAAYMHDLGRLRDWILHLRQSGARLRGVQQLIGPLDSLAREALFELALDEVPLPDAINVLVQDVGLPADLLTFPPDEEASSYQSFDELFKCAMAIERVRGVAKEAHSTDLRWACTQAETLLAFATTLASYVELTNSTVVHFISPTGPNAASAKHVLRTLVSAGRVFNRMFELAGPGAPDWLAAFSAPLLLGLLAALPPRARSQFEESMGSLTKGLPGLASMLSLVEATEHGLRHMLGVDFNNRLAAATEQQREALRRSTLAWAESCEHEAVRLRAASAVVEAGFG